MITIVARLVGWIAVWIGSLGVWVAFLSPGFAPIVVPMLGYATFRAVIQLPYFRSSIYIQRVLWQYPWQLLTGVPRGRNKHPRVQEDEMWFEFANPEKPEEQIPLLFLANMRTFWWMRRFGTARTKPELKAQIEPLWFAGDPRFVAVIAATSRGGGAPRRLHLLYQRTAAGRRGIEPTDWNASPAALERARRAGAKVPVAAPPQPSPY
ncbi:hypothetical protein ACFVXW_05435 [Streptomyces sp. NPDC058251]|uniref:hypothetical protein n=1 Tax=unclassified Streptomyces TaxID=2593676 RepID=UPI0036E34102